jgi:transposase
MPRSCATCEHPEREAIDRALVGGASNRRVASKFDLSEASVRRHKSNHLARKLVMAEKAAEVAEADNLLDRLEALQSRTLAILEATEETHEHRVALAAIREARSNIELIGEVTRELDRAGTINLELSPEWLQLRGVIVAALAPHPAALDSVRRALEGSVNGRA